LVTDPRKVIKDLFNPGLGYSVTPSDLTEENGDYAKHEASYEQSENLIKKLMLENPFNLDIIFIIIFSGENLPDITPSGPIAYNFVIGVQPVTIDKWNSDGSMKVNGTKLNYAAQEVIKKVIRENPVGSMRQVGIRRKSIERVGSGLIYADVTEIEYKQDTTYYT